MPRPKLCRKVDIQPKSFYFKPRGIPLFKLSEISLSREELEAINLKDFKDLSQNEAACIMKTSQSTFQRIVALARKKIAKSLIEGKALRIEK